MRRPLKRMRNTLTALRTRVLSTFVFPSFTRRGVRGEVFKYALIYIDIALKNKNLDIQEFSPFPPFALHKPKFPTVIKNMSG